MRRIIPPNHVSVTGSLPTRFFMKLRIQKSAAEVERIRRVCSLASEAYARLPELLEIGDSEIDACRKLEATCYALGADKTRAVGISGLGGHIRTFVGPTARILAPNDILFLDTGCTIENYYCDFNRHFAFAECDAATGRSYDLIWQATQAGIDAVKPGRTTSDIWHVMNSVVAQHRGENTSNSFGRMGHSMGLTGTELPSIAPDDHTVLVPGMILNIEPRRVSRRLFRLSHAAMAGSLSMA